MVTDTAAVEEVAKGEEGIIAGLGQGGGLGGNVDDLPGRQPACCAGGRCRGR